MNEFWSQLANHALAPYVAVAVIAIGGFFALKYFAKNKEDIQYAETALRLAKAALGQRLREKATLVFDALL